MTDESTGIGPLSDEERAEMLAFIRRWGSGNGWTGTLGQACCYIHRLLNIERESPSRTTDNALKPYVGSTLF